ncbi:MAG TPA: serine hydrolase [Steroidobacteraceae bacterium]|jgi:D-alanyl-D-alanine endopeptidase (penicillin-binding protein 7)|nr:serine hydrolase [Steroidobacteraceae bacterium]
MRLLVVSLVLLSFITLPQIAEAHSHHRHHLPKRVARHQVDEVQAAVSAATENQPLLASNEVLVVDEETQDVLLSKNSTLVSPIASITKLMTSLVVLEAGQPMDEMIEITEEDQNLERQSASRLRKGTVLTRAELLHLALMASENRAAHALARAYPGGLAACIRAMNAKARELGMDSTHYVEPTGLSEFNVSNPEDLAKLVTEASANPTIRDYSTDDRFAVPVGRHLVEFHTTDRLVANPSWTIVLQKTGYIVEAGRCLVMKAIIEDRPTVIVLMNSTGMQSRIADAQRIKSWLDIKATRLTTGVTTTATPSL